MAEKPEGPFQPITERPITPRDWECLDGTLYVEEGVPYIIFSHEWTQVHDGEIWAMPLSQDLTQAIGEPVRLFRASDNPEVSAMNAAGGDYVTDGPFLFKENGKLKMIWSSFYQGRYLVLEAESDGVMGPWKHGGSKYDFDGGHAMLFSRLDGQRMISLHAPNTAGKERALFMPY
jgi:hypothetical protein